MGLVFFTAYLKKLEIGNKCMKFKGLNLSVTEIMKLSYFQPNLKNKTQKNTNRYKNTIKYLSGLAVSLHPKNRMIYYVSTLEGCVVKVSTGLRTIYTLLGSCLGKSSFLSQLGFLNYVKMI